MYYSRNGHAFLLLPDFPLEVRGEPLCPALLNLAEAAAGRVHMWPLREGKQLMTSLLGTQLFPLKRFQLCTKQPFPGPPRGSWAANPT